jgi:hypothetical protein
MRGASRSDLLVLIEVLPFEKKWGVYIDGDLFCVGRDYDCDFAANMIGRALENAKVDHHPELRRAEPNPK